MGHEERDSPLAWHIEVNSGEKGLYMRCSLCGESIWIAETPSQYPMVIARFVADHDHERSENM